MNDLRQAGLAPTRAARPPGGGATQAAASLGFALVQLDVTVVNVALPRLGVDLSAGIAGLQWIVDGYALVLAVTLLIGGFLGDRFGARRMYLLGLAVFALGSALCGAAPSTVALVAARTIQGIGAAIMLPCSLSLINHATQHDPPLRLRAVGLWTACGSIGLAAGPLVGGLLLAAGSWRLIFLVNLPVCLVAALFGLRAPETPREQEGQGFDPLGQVLAILALGGLTGAVIEMHPLGPGHPAVLGLLALAFVAGPLFVAVERRSAAPLLPLGLFTSRVFSTAVVYGAVANVTLYGMMFVLSLYLQRVRGFDGPVLGLAYLPLTATFVAVNLVNARMVRLFGSRACMVGGFLMDALGFALLLPLGPDSPYWMALPAFVLIPAGMGTGIPAMIGAMLGSVERARSGVAAAVTNAARQAGGAMGVAVFGTLAGPDLVGGLHAAAATSVVLLVATAGAVWAFLPRRAGVR
ncbi:MFS transporter [Lichenihabitans sp. Uapishka_5]|uniref:MFS transporter n=1 Tax=Lichenihabitans sp. Uapishka_5 TaxID=3037302 RepID=UPI0029E81A62|nr:MFS transporter [Lichenihabitans sp. Uapishka_5]MDX7952879.1 MFS transporter [Lichenihabitans sp. Uapishka_5]